MKPLVVYHGGCRDGFCAAWVVWQKFGNAAEYFPGYHGQPPPGDLANREVVIVDFSYPRDVLKRMADHAESLLVLDHHATAEAALRGFEAPNENVRVVFDMERSGAGIAWDHYFPGQPRPWLVDYVEDRDLWRHALPKSHAVNSWIGVLKFDFGVWNHEHYGGAWTIADTGRQRVRYERGAEHAAELGKTVMLKVAQYVAEVGKNAIRFRFEGHDVPLVNAPQCDISELLAAMAEGEPFAMGWFQRADGLFQYSLRSRGGVDVSELANRHGGGGHREAAGFQLTRPADVAPPTEERDKIASEYNAYVIKLRKHLVAKALDEMAARPDNTSPESVIAFVVGSAFLDGGGMPSGGLLGMLGFP